MQTADERRVYADIEKVALEHGFDLGAFIRNELDGAEKPLAGNDEDDVDEQDEEQEGA